MTPTREELRALFNERVRDAKERVDLSQVITESGVELRANGSANCPWCGGRQKFSVNRKNGGRTWRCWKSGCAGQTGGDVIAFLMLYRNVTNVEACKILLSMAGLENPFDERRDQSRAGTKNRGDAQ